MNPFGIMIFLASMTAAPAAWPAEDDGRLDGLFERLRLTPDGVEASALEAGNWRIWLRSLEAKVNHLMAAASAAWTGADRMKRATPSPSFPPSAKFRRRLEQAGDGQLPAPGL